MSRVVRHGSDGRAKMARDVQTLACVAACVLALCSCGTESKTEEVAAGDVVDISPGESTTGDSALPPADAGEETLAVDTGDGDSGMPDACVPSCEGKDCGDDGCGGECGSCPCPDCGTDETECDDGVCVAPGAPGEPDYYCPGVEFQSPCTVETLDGCGETLDTHTFVYDENGNLVEENVAYAEGHILEDFVTYHLLGEDDKPAKSETDVGLDGTVDEVLLYHYDGELLTQTEKDAPVDGVADQITVYSYDENGNLTAKETDVGPDGAIDIAFFFAYDEAGNLVSQDLDSNGDGVVDTTWNHEYSETGQLLETEVSQEGQLEMVLEYSYDPDGNLAAVAAFDQTGAPVSLMAYEYDEAGNLRFLEETHTQPWIMCDGFQFSYAYDCWPCPAD